MYVLSSRVLEKVTLSTFIVTDSLLVDLPEFLSVNGGGKWEEQKREKETNRKKERLCNF